jgi:hypothetical protein
MRVVSESGSLGHLDADCHRLVARPASLSAAEYDAAQERGEVAKIGDNLPSVPKQNSKPTAADIGLSRKETTRPASTCAASR